jgi:hypothetical protein
MMPSLRLRRSIGVVLVALVLVACGSSDAVVSGVVVGVDGDLTTVNSFQVRTTEGDLLVFVPAPGIRFHDAAPLSHLTDHLVSGEIVEIVYETLNDGTLVATKVGDE